MATRPSKPNANMPTKLVGEGRQGDFVHQSQEMGTAKGFKNVSDHWLKTGCLSYAQVREKIETNRVEIEDLPLPFHAIEATVNDKNEFVFRHDGRDFKPTEFAFQHISGWAGVSKFDCEVLAGLRPDANGRMRHRPQDRNALLTLLDSGFSLIDPTKKFLFRTQKDGTLRAWLSDRYVIMDNRWFLDILEKIIPTGVFSHWRDDGDYSTLWGNILLPDEIREEKDSDYGGLFAIGNSEIGRRNLHATPCLFRAICMNGCIWDKKKGVTFTQVHRGKIDLMALEIKLRQHLHAQIPIFTGLIDRMLSTREIGWDGASAKPVFAALGDHFRLPKTTNTAILESWRKQSDAEEVFQDDKMRRSAFGVINAVTRSAEASKDASEWVKRDELGGHLLGWEKGKWASLFNRANSMKGDEVAEAFVMSHS